MTKASERRLELARQMAAVYAQKPEVRAMLVTGSVAEGLADDTSDIDMALYYEELPSQEEVGTTREQVGGSERIFFVTDPNGGGYVESYYREGIKHDFAHMKIAAWERDMAEVLEKHNLDSPMQKVLSGVLDSVPLLGEDLIAAWKNVIAAYPDTLAEAMVARHLKFYPPWVPEKMALGRGDLLFLYEIFVEAEKNILGILLGLNRIYHWGEYKRMDVFLGKMKIAPQDLSARLKQVLRDDPAIAVQKLDALIEETFALVERHMPQVSVEAARKRYRLPAGA